MEPMKNALPPEGQAKPAQNLRKPYEAAPRDRFFLLFTAAFCVLLADTFLWYGPTAGMTAAVFVWYLLVFSFLGAAPLTVRSNRVLLLFNLFLALTLALSSSWMFRLWNGLALLVLLPVHALALSGAPQLPWWRPAMLWERFCLLLWGLFGNLGASFAAISAGRSQRSGRHTASLVLGLAGSVILVAILLPVLSSADALFAAATAQLRSLFQIRLSTALWKLMVGLVLTPFLFGFLYSLRHPVPLKRKDRAPSAEPLSFTLVLSALVLLYALFLAVQSAGLFGPTEHQLCPVGPQRLFPDGGCDNRQSGRYDGGAHPFPARGADLEPPAGPLGASGRRESGATWLRRLADDPVCYRLRPFLQTLLNLLGHGDDGALFSGGTVENPPTRARLLPRGLSVSPRGLAGDQLCPCGFPGGKKSGGPLRGWGRLH